jgi:hypothetical protein
LADQRRNVLEAIRLSFGARQGAACSCMCGFQTCSKYIADRILVTLLTSPDTALNRANDMRFTVPSDGILTEVETARHGAARTRATRE